MDLSTDSTVMPHMPLRMLTADEILRASVPRSGPRDPEAVPQAQKAAIARRPGPRSQREALAEATRLRRAAQEAQALDMLRARKVDAYGGLKPTLDQISAALSMSRKRIEDLADAHRLPRSPRHRGAPPPGASYHRRGAA
jgi:hypothetical protein